MKDVIMSTPAISGEVLILRTLGHVYGLVEKDQRQQSAHADTIALRPSTRPRYVIARLVLLEDIRRREHRSVGLRRPAPAVIHRCSVSHATVSPRAT